MKRQMALVSKGIPIRNALDWLLWQTVILSVHVQAQVHVQIGIHRVAADLTKQVTQHQRHVFGIMSAAAVCLDNTSTNVPAAMYIVSTRIRHSMHKLLGAGNIKLLS